MGFLFDSGADEYIQKASQEFAGIKPPSYEDQALELDKYVEAGMLTPEQAQAYLADPSAMNGITLDPSLKQAQYDALASLQDIGNEGGLTSMDRAKLSQIQTEQDAAARGSREAILSNAAERGISGSGLELMSQMKNQQDSATRGSQRGLDVAAMAQQRALDALMQAGQLGGQMQAQDFGQKADIAKANDAIGQFNANQRQQVGLVNTGAKNDAQAKNLANKQQVSNANVESGNQQQQNNKAIAQQNFQNQMALAGGKAGMFQNAAALEQKRAESMGNALGAGLTAAATVIGGPGAAKAVSDERLKEDVEKFDPSSFLDELTSYKYNYKSPKHGGGEQVGVMAQDIEKGAPQMVEDTPQGKVVDYSKAGGPLFASLASLHERLKKVEGM